VPDPSALHDEAGGVAIPRRRSHPALPEVELLHPAGGGVGQLVEELDVARHEVIGGVLVDEGGQYLGGEGRSRLPHDAKLHFVLGVDLPFLSGEILERVLAASRGFDMTLPRMGETLETLCAVYSKGCITHIEALLMAGDKSVHELMGRVRVNILPEEEFKDLGGAAMFFNINTREDYEAAKKRVAHVAHSSEGVQHG